MGDAWKPEPKRFAIEERWNEYVMRYEASTIEDVFALQDADRARRGKMAAPTQSEIYEAINTARRVFDPRPNSDAPLIATG